jgi:hypothetical protein
LRQWERDDEKYNERAAAVAATWRRRNLKRERAHSGINIYAEEPRAAFL